MNNPSGCITVLFAIVLLVILAMSCVGTIYLFQADAVDGAISGVGNAISAGLGHVGQAILYIGIGVMGLALLVGLGLAIERAGPSVRDAGEGIAKAAIGQAVAGAIETGRMENLPPVWTIFGQSQLREPAPHHETEYRLLESGGEWDGTIQVPALRTHVDGAGRKADDT
jgi:hypothetical protein